MFEADACALGMAGANFDLVNGRQPLASDMLERARAGHSGVGEHLGLTLDFPPGLVGLAGIARVGAGRDQLARLVAPPASVGQRDIRVGAEAQAILSAVDPVAQPPPAHAVGPADQRQ